MVIYHGTIPTHVRDMRLHGLMPRGLRPTNWSELESRPDLVYLTSSYPFFFGRKGGIGGVLAVAVNSDQLYERFLLPDEDYIVQTGQVSTRDEEDAHSVAKANLESFQDQWMESLNAIGTCAYKGIIPPRSLIQFCRLDVSSHRGADLWFNAFYVEEIDLAIHRIHGAEHRECTEWAFGKRDSLPANIDWDATDRALLKLLPV